MTLLADGIPAGIRNQIYMASWNISAQPDSYQEIDEELKDIKRLADTTLDPTYGEPFERCAARVFKKTWQMRIPAPSKQDLVILRMIRSIPADFDYCDWVPEAEYFETPVYGAYSAGTGSVATRRDAVSVISPGLVPPGTFTAVFVGASTLTEWPVTWGTPDTQAPWHQEFALESMDVNTAEAGWLFYYPVYRAICDKAAPVFSFDFRESWPISLIEV